MAEELLNPSLKPPSITYSRFFPRKIIRIANDQLSQFNSSLGDESRRTVLYTSSDVGLTSTSDIVMKRKRVRVWGSGGDPRMDKVGVKACEWDKVLTGGRSVSYDVYT